MFDKRKYFPNSTQLPNIVVDELMADMSGNQLKVYLVVIRKTVGWHKESDAISISQICKLTGLADDRTVKRILRYLHSKGLINRAFNPGRSSTLTPLFRGVDENDRGGKKGSDPVVENEGSTPCKNTHSQNKRKQNIQNKEWFYKFYSEYPNKKAKLNAEKAFSKLGMTDELFVAIMESLKRQKVSDSWTKNNGQFIPLPATWLNGRRWEDETQIRKEGVTW